MSNSSLALWSVLWRVGLCQKYNLLSNGTLWLYCQYLSGNWWPKSTAEARRDRFRAAKLPTGVWKWSLVAAALFVVIAQSGLVVTLRIMAFPVEAFAAGYSIGGVPLRLAWQGILVASLVAGVCEETGLRGYLQGPLERRYGPGVGITIASIVFVLLHRHQAWATTILLHLFAWSVLWGILLFFLAVQSHGCSSSDVNGSVEWRHQLQRHNSQPNVGGLLSELICSS